MSVIVLKRDVNIQFSHTHTHANTHNGKESEKRDPNKNEEKKRKTYTQTLTNTIKYPETEHLLRSIVHSKQICYSNFAQIRFRVFTQDRICLQMNRFETNMMQRAHIHTTTTIIILIIINDRAEKEGQRERESKKKEMQKWDERKKNAK